MRTTISMFAAKMAIILGKLIGKKGSSMPGSLAMKICPSILKHLSGQVKEKIILICGTNGKTTTSNLLYSLIKSNGKKVVCNNVGANMLPGVACAFANSANIFGKLDADYAVLECDEASLRHIVNHVKADYIIVTNLFRDQLDRYGEIDITAGLLQEAFDKVDNVNLILNSDDPLCAYFGTKFNAKYYGISKQNSDGSNETKEGRHCLCCGEELKYDYYHYNQLGSYKCVKCGFSRPAPDYDVTSFDLTNGMNFEIKYNDTVHNIDVNYKGFYNIYNIVAAFAAYETLNLDTDKVNDVLNNYKPQIGRMETFNINNKNVILNLSKNPAGFNQAISTLSNDKTEKDVYIVVNDNPSDGTDISWIWDVDFEYLNKFNVKDVYVGGMRKDELNLRLKYAGIDAVCMADNKETLKDIIFASNRTCYMLVNYTALFEIQSNLVELEEEENK